MVCYANCLFVVVCLLMLKKSSVHKSGLMYVDFVDELKIQYVKKSQPGVRYYQ